MSRESQAGWKAAGVLLASVAGIAATTWAMALWVRHTCPEATWAMAVILGILAGIVCFFAFLMMYWVFSDLREHFLGRPR